MISLATAIGEPRGRPDGAAFSAARKKSPPGETAWGNGCVKTATDDRRTRHTKKQGKSDSPFDFITASKEQLVDQAYADPAVT